MHIKSSEVYPLRSGRAEVYWLVSEPDFKSDFRAEDQKFSD